VFQKKKTVCIIRRLCVLVHEFLCTNIYHLDIDLPDDADV